jgi:quercetin dioxygenase-like cupin family protein
MAAFSAALAAGCSTQPAEPTHNQSAAAAPATAPANPIQRPYTQTMSGQRLNLPPANFELVVTRAQYPPRHVIPCHKHSYPRYVFLQQGSLRVHNYATGRDYDFAAGNALEANVLVESYDQWHQGLVTSDVPVVLLAFEQVPPGAGNSTPCPTVPPPR